MWFEGMEDMLKENNKADIRIMLTEEVFLVLVMAIKC